MIKINIYQNCAHIKVHQNLLGNDPKNGTWQLWHSNGTLICDWSCYKSSQKIWYYFPFLLFCSLELWYNTVLILLTGHMKNAEIAIDALSIWYLKHWTYLFKESFQIISNACFLFLLIPFCSLSISGWEMMISFGFLAAARYSFIS